MKTSAKPLSAPGAVTLSAGCNQLINWGISFYMPGTFARAIAQETGWAATEIYFGLTIAMLMMAMLSPFVARLLAHFGGQRIVVTGTLMISAGCLIMAYVHSLSAWFAAWALTGVGMRLALYDALFAALVNSYGQSARLTISRVMLAGGLASALFWPLGAGLLTQMNWRHALLIYALFGLLSAMLLWKMPNHKLPSPRRTIKRQRLSGRDKRSALLYASLIALVTFVSNGTSTPLRLTLLTTLVMPLCFALGLSGSYLSWAAGGFVLGYGAINGLTTVFKATLPLQLFAAEDYARRTGILLIPAQLLAAASPFVYAWLNHHLGMRGSLAVSAALALVVFGLAMSIAWDHREKTPAEIEERG